MSILRLRELAGFDVPSFHEYLKKGTIKETGGVELTEAAWAAIDPDKKGLYEGKKYYLTFENGALGIVPVKTTFLGVPSHDELTKAPEVKDEVKDETKAEGGDPEKAADDMVDSVNSGKRKTDTSEVKEAAEDKAKALIASVKSGKRITNTSVTQVDSNTSVSEPKDELGTASIETCDLEDEKVSDGGVSVKESAEDVAKRIIAAVNAGNHPHDAKNDGDADAGKSKGTDYNGMIGAETTLDAARANDAKETEVVDDKCGIDTMRDTKIEFPKQVASQIDQRIKDLTSAKDEYDNKGYNDTSVKQNAIDFLNKVKDHLQTGELEGLKQAQILFGTLMSPITDLLPAALINFLGTAANTANSTGTKPEVN